MTRAYPGLPRSFSERHPLLSPLEGQAIATKGPFQVGQLVGEVFKITRILGVGGMGVVYEARDIVLLRYVAIKVPGSPGHEPALRAEAQALAAIRSPAFVTVHHVARHEGIEFMVMERLFGETLHERLLGVKARGLRLSLDEVIDLLIAVADALSAAHAVGIAQRDLKPANIVICGERVVLVDMGLFVPEVLVAPENDVAGSADYIAPEVLTRSVEKGKGPLIDLYALGILAYELLTNKTPFDGASLERTFTNHIYAPIPDVRELRPDVPSDLAALMVELLAKSPDDRPPGAEAVLWQLKHIRVHGLRRAGRMTVLAVDDEAHVGISLKRSLESAFPQIHVEPTTDPEKAILSVQQAPPDVVLVDLNMPKYNGVEVCMSLMAIPADRRPVVVGMSARATEDDIKVLRSLGVRHFVPKDASFVAAMSEVIRDLRTGGAK